MGQNHVNALKCKAKGELERLKIRKKPVQRPESQQALHPTAEVAMPKCEGAFNGDNRGKHCIPAQEFDNEICRFCYVALPNAT